MTAVRQAAPFLRMAALAALSLALPPAARAQNIDTTPAWDGQSNFNSFGTPNTTAYGQTITPTVGQTTLQSFTFYFKPTAGSAPTFQAYVAAWDGKEITSPLLYTSAATAGPDPASTVFTSYTFNTGGVTLTAGQQYALFVSSANHYSLDTQQDVMGATSTDAYAGGAFIYDNVGSNFNGLYSQWDQTGDEPGGYGSNRDLAFKADFATAAPEPSSVAAFAFTGLGAAGLILRARRRKSL